MQADDHLGEFLRQAIEPALKGDRENRVLLLSCIDLRYPQRIIDTMDGMGFQGRYFHLALAGASHAPRHSVEWEQTFFDHLGFAVQQGHVTGVVVLDHLDCKAFQLYEDTTHEDLEGERLKHHETARELVAKIVSRHPSLKGRVHALLLPVEPPQPDPEPLASG